MRKNEAEVLEAHAMPEKNEPNAALLPPPKQNALLLVGTI